MSPHDNVLAIPDEPISFTKSMRLQGTAQKPVAGFCIQSQGSDQR
jgi:hypothetical protein